MQNKQKYKEARSFLLNYLRECAKEKGITHATIAEKTGFTSNNVSRMLQGRYSPTLDNFLRLAEAVGVYFFVIEKNEDDELIKIMKKRWGKLSDN